MMNSMRLSTRFWAWSWCTPFHWSSFSFATCPFTWSCTRRARNVSLVSFFGTPYLSQQLKTTLLLSDRFRRSNDDVLGRAKKKTLLMTITIVIVFVVCWTPYYVMSVWYWLDKETALKVDKCVQKGLFLFACANSCMNPIVYGLFNIPRRTDKNNLVSWIGLDLVWKRSLHFIYFAEKFEFTSCFNIETKRFHWHWPSK